jgi:Spy/CpxP family protein refolding chaperone
LPTADRQYGGKTPSLREPEMQSKGFITVLTVLVLVATGIVAASYLFGFTVRFESRCKSKTCKAGDSGPRFCLHKALNLNSEQIATCDEFNRIFQEKTVKIRKGLRHDKIRLAELLMAPEVDKPELDGTVETISELQKELQLEVVNHLLNLKTILTPEQQEKLFTMIVRRMCVDGFRGKRPGAPAQKERDGQPSEEGCGCREEQPK